MIPFQDSDANLFQIFHKDIDHETTLTYYMMFFNITMVIFILHLESLLIITDILHSCKGSVVDFSIDIHFYNIRFCLLNLDITTLLKI